MKESITIYHEMSQVEEGQMLLFSDSHSPTLYGIHTPQVEVIRRRRRKKKEKGEEGRKKRRLSHEQVRMLESHFWSEHKLEAGRRDQLAVELGLDPHVVAVWFQNRRARWKAKQVEEEYESLKARHQTVLVDKCRLQAEVSKLKEQISEAEKEIKRLSERFHGVSSQGEISCSTISTLSKDDHHHEPFLMGDFDVEENGNFLYIPEYYYIDDLEWVNLGGF